MSNVQSLLWLWVGGCPEHNEVATSLTTRGKMRAVNFSITQLNTQRARVLSAEYTEVTIASYSGQQKDYSFHEFTITWLRVTRNLTLE